MQKTASRRTYCKFTFVENTIKTNSPNVPRAKFLGSDRLCFISICKFDNFKKPFAMTTTLSDLTLNSED